MYWSYILTAVGITGFWLAGRKVWWAWYVNIGNQALWLAYAWITGQWGFVLGTVFYTVVFVKNAVSWTKEHFRPKYSYLQGTDFEKMREYAKADVDMVVGMYRHKQGMLPIIKGPNPDLGYLEFDGDDKRVEFDLKAWSRANQEFINRSVGSYDIGRNYQMEEKAADD